MRQEEEESNGSDQEFLLKVENGCITVYDKESGEIFEHTNIPLETLPQELQGAFRPLIKGETEERCHDLVKAADKLSAYIKCIEERRAGNDEFISAEKQTRKLLEQSPLPEVRYFMEHFIPAFELTLDELGTIEE